jgi:autotransporter-associated beta strand protein
MRKLFPVICVFSCLIAADSFAGSATWSANPTSDDWNAAANWTPNTVPNGPADIATFGSSAVSYLAITSGVEVDSMVFNSGADAFTINTSPGVILRISGAGVINNSGVVQTVVVRRDSSTSGELHFTNDATAGDAISYVNWARGGFGGVSALILFEDTSSAGSAEFYNHGASVESRAGLIEFQGNSTAANGRFHNTRQGDEQFPTINFRDNASAGQAVIANEVDSEGLIHFYDSSTADQAIITSLNKSFGVIFYDDSTAGNATITCDGSAYDTESPFTFFFNNSSAGSGTFILNGSLGDDLGQGDLEFYDYSTAGNGTFIANGAEAVGDLAQGGSVATAYTADHGTFYANGGKLAGAQGGRITISNFGTADAGIFYANGATVDGALGGRVFFLFNTPTAANSTLIATGGVGTGEGAGGGILFEDDSVGDEATVELDGNGFLDLRNHESPELTIGSLGGDGLVFLGSVNLSVGSNNLNSKFSGVIEENSEGVSGALTKIGTGSLTLSGASIYTGGTTLITGALIISNASGSGTGTGTVTVQAGTLGGKGIIAGPTTIGTGRGSASFLQPSKGASNPTTLTVQDMLTFKSDSTYVWKLNTNKVRADKIVANGVSIETGAQFSFTTVANKKLTAGKVFTAINNTSASSISGTFANLADGSTVIAGRNNYQVSYSGGDGNDLTLTVVP